MILKPPKGALPIRGHPLTPTAGLWLMNEAGGDTVADLSGNGNTATEQVASYWRAGTHGPSRYFDETSYLLVPVSPSIRLIGPQSIVIWFKYIGDGALAARWNADEAWMIDVHTGGIVRILFRINNSSEIAQTTQTYNDGKWHCLVATYDRQFTRIDLDGGAERVTGEADSGDIDNPALGIGIGAKEDGTYGSESEISSVSLYNRALTAGEISKLYREPFCMFEGDL